VDIFLEVFCNLATKILMAVAICCHSSTYLANIQNNENKEQYLPFGYGNLGPRVAVGLFGVKIRYKAGVLIPVTSLHRTEAADSSLETEVHCV
jgi:hypothetical protein